MDGGALPMYIYSEHNTLITFKLIRKRAHVRKKILVSWKKILVSRLISRNGMLG